MSFFANRSSRHAARLGSALTAHPAAGFGVSAHPPGAHRATSALYGPSGACFAASGRRPASKALSRPPEARFTWKVPVDAPESSR